LWCAIRRSWFGVSNPGLFDPRLRDTRHLESPLTARSSSTPSACRRLIGKAKWKAVLASLYGVHTVTGQQLGAQTPQLGLAPVLARALHRGHGLTDRIEGLLELAATGQNFGQ